MKPKRGEIWLVEFEPQIGTEIQKTRPALILSIQPLRFLTTRIVVPIRDFKEHHAGFFFYIPVEPEITNGLSKKSTIDCSQVKSFDFQRFQKKLGNITDNELEEVADTVSRCIGYL